MEYRPVGRLQASDAVRPDGSPETLRRMLAAVNDPFSLVLHEGRPAAVRGGVASVGGQGEGLPLLAHVPALNPRSLGDPSFCRDLGLTYPLVAGAMYHGITSVEMVEAVGRAGMIGFFGAGGLSLTAIEDAVGRLQASLGDRPFGVNVLHSPLEPGHEDATVDLLLRRGVRVVSASAYLDLTLPIVRYRVAGIRRRPDGVVETPNRILAKLSRAEVAAKFFAPPPERFLRELVAARVITSEQAAMAAEIPMAQDVTAEADSGGHTDNRPFVAMVPTIMALRDAAQARHGYAQPLRVGAGGGLGTPSAMAAAFAMGVAYVITGSVNQSCVEAGTSDAARAMLCKAEQADVTMAPAADMFEMGVRVQVLKRGTMFPMRAARLWELFRSCDGVDAIPAAERETLERTVFRAPLADVWRQTAAYFAQRDPSQVERAEREPKHKLALVFRWYLGRSSGWATAGEASRQIDFQIQCGPAMGAFNEWVRGTYLEGPAERRVVNVNLNLLYGAAVLGRIQAIRGQGLVLPPEATRVTPLPPGELLELLGDAGR